MPATLPLLYTFRRCPYAMRARWAIGAAGVAVQMVEVSLRAKPAAMLAASPKGTVPVLVLPGGQVIEQSLEIMLWALAQADPQGWLRPERGTLADMLALVDACERDFKPHLDRAKYATRYITKAVAGQKKSELASTTASTVDAGTSESFSKGDAQTFAELHLIAAEAFLRQVLQPRLEGRNGSRENGAVHYLFGVDPHLADFAIAPFVRQLQRHVPERAVSAWPPMVVMWLEGLLGRLDFANLMSPQGPDWAMQPG